MGFKHVRNSLALVGLIQTVGLGQGAGYSAPSFEDSVVSVRKAACDCGKRGGLTRAVHHAKVCKQRIKRATIGIREEYVEPPLGQSLHNIFQTQVAVADAARMAFYRYDFVGRTAELNDRGKEKVAEIARILPTSFAPVLVERTPNGSTLDEARRQAILSEFNRGNFPVPPERVVVGLPMPAGRIGSEAILMDATRLGAMATGAIQPFSSSSGGVGGGGGTGGVGGFDTSGVSSGISPR